MTDSSAIERGATVAGSAAGELKLEIGCGPICPHCRLDTFDDWHHERTLKPFCLGIKGRFKCHGCGKSFSFKQYLDGECHSAAVVRPRRARRALTYRQGR